VAAEPETPRRAWASPGSCSPPPPGAPPRGRLDGYKVPKAVIVVDELPKTSTGKIQKNVVRDQHTAHYGNTAR